MAGLDKITLEASMSEQLVEVNKWLSAEKSRITCPIPTDTGKATEACPWVEVTTTDENRIPVHISRAVCRCNGCHDFQLGEISTKLGYCQEIIKPTIVQRRASRDSPYIVDVEMVPRACACNTSPDGYSLSYANYLEDRKRVSRAWLQIERVNHQSCHSDESGEMCPWTSVTSIDENRIPKRIWKAVCKCESCKVSVRDESQWGCEEVMTPMRIARRDDQDSPFYLDIEMVPTACVCKQIQ